METKKLLRAVGYPESDLPTPLNPVESLQLYDYARRNKVGSLYVQSLNKANKIKSLSEQWKNRQNFQERIRETMNRLPEVIPARFEYAVAKSGYSWVDSKDIDIILFDDQLNEAENHLTDLGYEFCGRSPTSFDVLDPKTNIQLDVQSAFSLQQVVYFDKQVVENGVEQRSPYGTSVPILQKPDDLALIVIHSITEQMYILKEFYTAVAMLESFSRDHFERFLDVVDRNNIGPACRAFFTITQQLCEHVFEQTPPYLREILHRFGVSNREQDAFRSNQFKTPHKYISETGIRTIAGKLHNPVFRRSLASQLPRLVHPATAYYILSQIVTRRERDHYVHDTSDMVKAEE